MSHIDILRDIGFKPGMSATRVLQQYDNKLFYSNHSEHLDPEMWKARSEFDRHAFANKTITAMGGVPQSNTIDAEITAQSMVLYAAQNHDKFDRTAAILFAQEKVAKLKQKLPFIFKAGKDVPVTVDETGQAVVQEKSDHALIELFLANKEKTRIEVIRLFAKSLGISEAGARYYVMKLEKKLSITLGSSKKGRAAVSSKSTSNTNGGGGDNLERVRKIVEGMDNDLSRADIAREVAAKLSLTFANAYYYVNKLNVGHKSGRGKKNKVKVEAVPATSNTRSSKRKTK